MGKENTTPHGNEVDPPNEGAPWNGYVKRR